MLLKASSRCHRPIGSEFKDEYLTGPAVPWRTQPTSSSSCRAVVEGRNQQNMLETGVSTVSLCYFPVVQQAYMTISVFICLRVCAHVQQCRGS